MLIKRFTETAVLPRRATEGSAGYDLSADLSQPEVIQQVQMVDGSPVVSQAANPKYLTGSTRILYQFFVDLLPSGQALQIASAQVAHPIQILLYSSGVTVLLNLIGIYLFNRKNLK